MCLIKLEPATTVEHGFYAVKVFTPVSETVLSSCFHPNQRAEQNPYGDKGDLLEYEVGALAFSPIPDTPGMYCYHNSTRLDYLRCKTTLIYTIYIPPGATIREGYDFIKPAFVTDMLYVCGKL